MPPFTVETLTSALGEEGNPSQLSHTAPSPSSRSSPTLSMCSNRLRPIHFVTLSVKRALPPSLPTRDLIAAYCGRMPTPSIFPSGPSKILNSNAPFSNFN